MKKTIKILTISLCISGFSSGFINGSKRDKGCKIKRKSLKSFLGMKKIIENPQEITKEDYDAFKVIMKIHEIVDEEILKAKEYGTNVGSGRKVWPEPSPSFSQTKKGFFIEGENCLYTPFGEVKLTGGASYPSYGLAAFRQKLYKRLKTKFSHIYHQGSCCDDPIKYKILKSNDIDLSNKKLWYQENYNPFVKITEKELVEKKDKKNIILYCNDYDHEPVYELLEIDRQKLPKPEHLDEKNYRENDYINTIWKAMEKKHSAELYLKQRKKYMSHFPFLDCLFDWWHAPSKNFQKYL